MYRNENSLAKRINTLEICSSYDQLCKKLLSNKQILAWILKSCVAEFAECSIQDIAEKYIEGGTGKQRFLYVQMNVVSLLRVQ